MECPSPQPGHQVKPNSFSGHNVKCVVPTGLVSAKATNPAIQNASSKYLSKSCLINFIGFAG